MKYYQCSICGNIMEVIYDAGVTPECCGIEMEEVEAGMTDGAAEKHVPIVQVTEADSDKQQVFIKVGEMPHPMDKNHFIEWICLKTDRGVYRRCLKPDEAPETGFYICKEERVLEAFAWCNLHGLWKNQRALSHV